MNCVITDLKLYYECWHNETIHPIFKSLFGNLPVLHSIHFSIKKSFTILVSPHCSARFFPTFCDNLGFDDIIQNILNPFNTTSTN